MRSPAMEAVQRIGEGCWGLGRAREVAREVEGSDAAVGALVRAMFGADGKLRKRGADVARRITERSGKSLWKYADQLAGLLAEIDPEERRTRWHLGLVVARVARTREQRLRAARMMEMLAVDEGNVVRCSGIEGIGLLACAERSLGSAAQEIAERAMHTGTKAERCRARESLERMRRAGILEGGE